MIQVVAMWLGAFLVFAGLILIFVPGLSQYPILSEVHANSAFVLSGGVLISQ